MFIFICCCQLFFSFFFGGRLYALKILYHSHFSQNGKEVIMFETHMHIFIFIHHSKIMKIRNYTYKCVTLLRSSWIFKWACVFFNHNILHNTARTHTHICSKIKRAIKHFFINISFNLKRIKLYLDRTDVSCFAYKLVFYYNAHENVPFWCHLHWNPFNIFIWSI